jgi:hypothetical protein
MTRKLGMVKPHNLSLGALKMRTCTDHTCKRANVQIVHSHLDSGAKSIDGGGGQVEARERTPYQPPSAERDRLWVNRTPARRRLTVKGVPAGRFLEVMQALVKEMNEKGWEAALVPETFQEFTPRTLLWLQAGKWDECEVCEAWLELGVKGL